MFKRRSKSAETALTIPRGEKVLITQEQGKVTNIPKIKNHPEINTDLRHPHHAVIIQNNNDEIEQFYVDRRMQQEHD